MHSLKLLRETHDGGNPSAACSGSGDSMLRAQTVVPQTLLFISTFYRNNSERGWGLGAQNVVITLSLSTIL